MSLTTIYLERGFAFLLAALLTVYQPMVSAESITTTGTLTVQVESLATNDGQLRFVIFDTKKNFLKRALKAEAVEIDDFKGTWVIEDLPFGTYAVLVHHDTNGNGKMERHWYGKPKEPSGVSNDPAPRMGPPKYDAAKFEFNEVRQTIVITVR